MYSVHVCHVHFEYCSLIRFPSTSRYFWAEWMCAVKRGLTVPVYALKSTQFNETEPVANPTCSSPESWKCVLQPKVESVIGNVHRYDQGMFQSTVLNKYDAVQ